MEGHVKLLLEKGADITVASEVGWTPLDAVSSRGHVEVIKLLLEKGADVAVANKAGRTPLHAASNNGHVEVVKLLLGVPSVDASNPDRLGRTALFLYGQIGLEKILSSRSAVRRSCSDERSDDFSRQ